MKKIVFIFTILLNNITFSQKNFNINGNISNGETNIELAQIIIKGHNKTIYTDSNGFFSIKNIER